MNDAVAGQTLTACVERGELIDEALAAELLAHARASGLAHFLAQRGVVGQRQAVFQQLDFILGQKPGFAVDHRVV